ncbi:hypothetical protein [Lichenicoccus sp.]|uniref:hypothetical protein n=1 Tax=Lichenicoccus sp. TaxID=2781899 RepID=UPI003D0B03FB
MTTMSMTRELSNTRTDWMQRATRLPPNTMPTTASHAAEPGLRDATVWEECCDRVLEVSGGLALALVPFATLAWMFVAW